MTNAAFKHMFLIRETICNKLKVAWTYPSPKPTFCHKWEVSVDVGLGEGWVGSFPPAYNDPCSEGQYLSSWSINFDAINKDLEKKPPLLY